MILRQCYFSFLFVCFFFLEIPCFYITHKSSILHISNFCPSSFSSNAFICSSIECCAMTRMRLLVTRSNQPCSLDKFYTSSPSILFSKQSFSKLFYGLWHSSCFFSFEFVCFVYSMCFVLHAL